MDVTSHPSSYPITGLFEEKEYEEGWDVTSISFLARLNVHFATTEKLDAYWGAGAGYKLTNWKWHSDYINSVEGSLSNPIPVGFETTVGLRYYVVDPVALYMEMGIAKSLI